MNEAQRPLGTSLHIIIARTWAHVISTVSGLSFLPPQTCLDWVNIIETQVVLQGSVQGQRGMRVSLVAGSGLSCIAAFTVLAALHPPLAILKDNRPCLVSWYKERRRGSAEPFQKKTYLTSHCTEFNLKCIRWFNPLIDMWFFHQYRDYYMLLKCQNYIQGWCCHLTYGQTDSPSAGALGNNMRCICFCLAYINQAEMISRYNLQLLLKTYSFFKIAKYSWVVASKLWRCVRFLCLIE